MHPVESQSAFGFYQKDKVAAGKTGKKKKPGNNSSATKIKTKYEELCNKKLKQKKVKKAATVAGVSDWSVRRRQFEELKNGRASDKSAEIPEDSRAAGKQTFKDILSPFDVDRFMDKHWEKKPLLISRSEDRNHFADLLCIAQIDEAINTEHVEYTANVDVTSYKDGERITLNPDGRANSADVWESYNEGCSIRFLNPHLFFPSIYRLNSSLQEYFSCMVGANVYLTPPNSQGFAPHYDDIEAFVLQVEGQKHWRVYAPRSVEETLPRVSSPNFRQEDIGEPIMDIVLEPGDLLYFPRGFIHQANTVPGHHSLHITLSTYQKNSWADLMEHCMKSALAEAIRSNVEFRRGVPLDMGQHLGAVHAYTGEKDSVERKKMLSQVKSLFSRLGDYLPVDDAADQLQKKFQHDALPPLLTGKELQRTARGCSLKVSKGNVTQHGGVFSAATQFRMLKANVARIVLEEGETRLYYHLDNSKYYHQYEPVFLEIDHDSAPAVGALIRAYPQYLSARDVEGDTEGTLSVFTALWKRGLLVTRNVLGK